MSLENCVMKIEFRKISSIMSKWIDTIFHIQTTPDQWIRRKVKDTKIIIFTNSRYLKKMALNPV